MENVFLQGSFCPFSRPLRSPKIHCIHLVVCTLFICRRFMQFARVLECPGKEKRICTRDKVLSECFNNCVIIILLLFKIYNRRCSTYMRCFIHVLHSTDEPTPTRLELPLSLCEDFCLHITVLLCLYIYPFCVLG